MSQILDVTGQRKWGILGDGQLARMLALAAYPLGIRPVVLTGDPSSPAGQVSPLQVRGQVGLREDVHGLLSQVEGVILESEFVDCDLIESTGLADRLVPGLKALRILQDKLEQKKMLLSLGLPTSSLLLESVEDLSELTDQNAHTSFVLKYARFGYDGRGVHILRETSPSQLEHADEFLLIAKKRKIKVYAEAFVPFQSELAMIAVRKRDGTFATWPLVLSEQTHGVCFRVMGPAMNFNISEEIQRQAQTICKTIGDRLDIVGVYAVEFFLDKQNNILVNEIAPRVHNSGHYTQNAATTSQFENHWRAVLDLPLGPTTTSPFFAMQNILGPRDITSKEAPHAPHPQNDIFSHWYGKRGVSPGRKLGHFNTFSKDFSDKEHLLKLLADSYHDWCESLASQPHLNDYYVYRGTT